MRRAHARALLPLLVALVVLFQARPAPAAPASYCDQYYFYVQDLCSGYVSCGYGYVQVCGYWEYCDGRRQRIDAQCQTVADWNYYSSNRLSSAQLCTSAINGVVARGGQAPPAEACNLNSTDEDCDGDVNEVCPELCGDAFDNNDDGRVDESCPETCGDGRDNNSNGQVDEGCAEVCGNGLDDNSNGSVDEDCEMPDAPPPDVTPPDATTDPTTDPNSMDALLDEMNTGCPNGDWAGYDPIHLGARSAATDPFTDFGATVLRPLALTRSYTSGEVMNDGTAGVFGLGWHHNWETSLTCGASGGVNGASCTVKTGLGETMQFLAQAGTVTGVGALAGEALVLYRRTELEKLAAGGYNLMVRRPSGEFILFQLDGTELHFLEPASCTGTYCMDAGYNGALRLTRDVDAAGRGVQLDFTVSGKLLTVTDDLGNRMSLAPSSCAGRAGSLAYRVGPSGVDSTYVTYEYDSTCTTLTKVVPANYTPAPGKTAQLRRYEYQSTPKAGLLTVVRNEQDDPIAVFGYDGATGLPTSLVDAQSSLTVSYPQGNQDVVVSAYGSLQGSRTTYRDSAGKASSVDEVTGLTAAFDELWTTGQEKMTWNGRYLVCSESLGRYVRYFQRDTHGRVTTVADYGATPFATSGTVYCRDAPWNSRVPLRSTRFDYGLVKTIAQGVTMPLEAMTRTYRTSVFGAAVSNASTSETLDYDPTAKVGDPAGYACGTASLPVGGLVCRKIVEGYTYDANRTPILQKLATFYGYDARGRVTKIVGPIYLAGTPPPGNVDPVEERTYWPDDDADVLRRGRLKDVKRWPGGHPDAARALVTTYQLYDVFGPTQVIDESSGTTVYSRAGGAGRVTRVDGPDGRHVITRYYDGEKPRLVLLNGGSAQRFTYDGKGRLHVVEPLSGDPDAGAVIVGWTEIRDHDAAGNTTLVTRKDAAGTVRWKQAFEHYPNGELRKMPHPEAGKGYARWTRYPNGVAEYYWDEDQHITHTQVDALKRTKQVTFEYWNGSSRIALPGGFSYEYEPGQDALSKVSSMTSTTGTPGGVYPVVAQYVHDDFGRLLSVSSPYTMTAGPYLYAYDARGNVVKRTGGGAELAWQYDGLNRVTQLVTRRLADASTFTYTYTYDDPTARGRLRSIVEPDRTTTFVYDEVGRTRYEVLAETGVLAQLTTEYRYDLDGKLSEILSPSGLHVKYERDPVTKDITEVRNVVTGTKYATNVKHLPSGPITDLTFAGGATLAQGFDLRYEPQAISSGPLALSYTVTGSGLATAVGPMFFSYDKRDRLERATPSYTPPYTYVYPYDSGATWLAVNDRPKEAQDESGRRKYAFAYDDGSSMSAISSYDAAGTSITGTTCLVHDALGRLTAVGPAKVVAGPDARACKSESDLSSVTVRFRYDARNRRVGRQDGTGPWKQYVFTSDGTPLAELTKPTTSGAAWTFQREYVWLDGRPLAQIEYPGPAGGAEGYVYLVHVDHLGQPRALTSTAGVTVWSASPPRPYGDMSEATVVDPANGRTIVTNLRLPGQYDERLLGSLGLQGPFYNGMRWYLPSLARYLELDPLALHGGLNGGHAPDWYGYGKGNPLRWTDRNGELALSLAGAVVGGVFGAVYGGVSAALTGGDIFIGATTGGLTGAAFGALIDPSAQMAVGAYLAIQAIGGAASAGVGSLAGQAWDKGWDNVNWWGVGGATLAGAAGGLFEGAAGYYMVQGAFPVSAWGIEATANFVGGAAAMAGEIAGSGFGDRDFRPWEDGGSAGDWVTAAGCK